MRIAEFAAQCLSFNLSPIPIRSGSKKPTIKWEQAEAISCRSSQLNWYMNLLFFYSEHFAEVNNDSELSLSGAIVMEKTLKDTSKFIMDIEDSLGPIFKQLPVEKATT